jgi:hypothetical protein
MKFKFQNKIYTFPVSLSDIKLRQRIEFDALYGKEIVEKHKSIFDKDGKPTDPTEAVLFQLEVACKNFSFFSGIDLDDVFKIPIGQVMDVYHVCFEGIQKQENELKFSQKHYWNNEVWKIEAPEINYESKITFNEFVTSKQIVKTMNEMGHGQWEVLPSLCAIFLRKEGELFDEKFLSGQTNRTELMKDLPLDIALCVAFFLASSMNSYSRTIQYFKENQARERAQAWQTTSMSGVGSAS